MCILLVSPLHHCNVWLERHVASISLVTKTHHITPYYAQQQQVVTMLRNTEAPACGHQSSDFHVCRLTGRATFKRALLAKHGKLVLNPQHKLSSSVDELAAYLQQELEAAVGGSLDPYCC